MSLGEELDISSDSLPQTANINPRQVFTLPGSTEGIFVFSDYDFASNTLTGITWVHHDFPVEPIIPPPDSGQVLYNTGACN